MARAVAVAVALVSLWSAPGRAAAELTVPPNGISGCAVFAAGGAGVTENPAQFSITRPALDRVEVDVAAGVGDSLSVPGLYEGEMTWTCLLAGAGTLRYGSASGSMALTASSTPDFLPPTPVNEPNIFTNNGYARGDGLLELQFDDTGVVVSDTLPAGTPVQLEFQYSLDATLVAIGPPSGPLVSATATYFPRAVDTAAPGAPAIAILVGTDAVTRTLDTAVGRTIELQGRLALRVLALAGREVPGALYYENASAEADAANTSHFSLVLPEGVLLATGVLVLAGAGRPRPRRLRNLRARGRGQPSRLGGP